METPQNPSAFERLGGWMSQSVMLKLFVVGFLMLILLIPTAMLQDLITERQHTRDTASQEITSKWGGDQQVGGPVLTVPYLATIENEKGQKTTVREYAHFLPEHLSIKGTVTPQQRYRGIYVVMLYNTRLRIEGTFSAPNLSALKIPEGDYRLADAFVSLGVSDLKGIKEAVKLRFGNEQLTFNPGVETSDIFGSGVSVPVRIEAGQQSYKFSCELNLNGSSALNFLPLGKETTVHLQSSWATPSFVGSFLPEQRNITPAGFESNWKVLQYNRNYPQQGVGAFIPRQAVENAQNNPVVASAYDQSSATSTAQLAGAFGVKLLLPIDEYQKTTRSAKYAGMFILITFTAFFFVEILNRRKLHPIQYLLVGFAVCLFYVLLLSISEHLSFNWAYLIGCATVLGLVTFYTKSIFRNTRLTLIFNGIITLLYGFFYSLLQLEDYALLLGSVGLVFILGTVMYLTRHIDWYNIYGKEAK
jgi:inner membrane protein